MSFNQFYKFVLVFNLTLSFSIYQKQMLANSPSTPASSPPPTPPVSTGLNKLLSHFLIPGAFCTKLLSHFAIPDALCNKLLPHLAITLQELFSVSFVNNCLTLYYHFTILLCQSLKKTYKPNLVGRMKWYGIIG